jgi:2-hydroxy-6-oxonona-2,4-dienedioate hydrolase
MPAITEASSSKYVEIVVDGLPFKVHYNDDGEGEPVVMLHGSGPGASGWSNFHRNIGPFSAAGYRVILLDCPGWNKSDSFVCKESRPHHIAKTVVAFLDKLGIASAHLVGNSMGTVAAIDFAMSFPDRLRKLVLLGGGGVGPSLFTPMPPEGIKRLQELYAAPNMENLMKMLEIFVYDFKSLSPELIEQRLTNINARPDHLQNWADSFKVYPNQFPDISARLGEINAPALMIWGRDDRFTPLDFGLRMLWGIKQSELCIFSQCGHWAQFEHADKFNDIAIAFLKR